MSEESETTLSTKLSASRGDATGVKSVFRIKKERINWIDQARGFIMFYLVLTEFFPKSLLGNDPFTAFFFTHPSPEESPWMNAYDIGVPAFLFIIGLLYSVSFSSRMRKKGSADAISNAVLRWGLIYMAGMIIILATKSEGFGEMKEIAPGVEMFVVTWDVLSSVGLIGLICIPFMFLQRKPRLIVSYTMMSFFQAMLFIPGTYWREYSLKSFHGGILGGIFVLTPIVLTGSCIGEYYIMDVETPRNEKNKKLAIFAAINLAIGLVLWAIPGGYPNKRMSTMSWAVISLAAIIVGLFVFTYSDYETENYPNLNPVNRFRITLFKAYGVNSLLIYVLAVTPSGIVALTKGDLSTELELTLRGTMVIATSMIAYTLCRKSKVISTTKVALAMVIILVVLFAILLLLGVL
jgi:hypothetical protein